MSHDGPRRYTETDEARYRELVEQNEQAYREELARAKARWRLLPLPRTRWSLHMGRE